MIFTQNARVPRVFILDRRVPCRSGLCLRWLRLVKPEWRARWPGGEWHPGSRAGQAGMASVAAA